MGAAAAAARLLRRPRRFLDARVQAWARKRQGADPDPVTLHRRRTYILPSALGYGFALTLFAMLLASMNYNSSMGFGLTFLLASLGLVTMHWCHQNLTGLTARGFRIEAAFAGEDAALHLVLENGAGTTRYEIQASWGGREPAPVDLAPGASVELRLPIPTRHRGRLVVDRVSLSSRFPFGLFRCWAWLYPEVDGVVYPAPAERGRPPPPDDTDTGGAQDDRRGEEDFAGLRPFRPGDSPRHVAWKSVAREGELLVKQFAGTRVTSHWLDWDSLTETHDEARLSRLCRWIVDAHADGHAYGLRLPGLQIPPAIGRRHRHRCLAALALFPGWERQHG